MKPLVARKRIFSVMVEAFQNADKHGAGQPTLHLQKDSNQYVIETTNRIRNTDREKITERLSEINTLDEHQLRSKYLEVLQGPATTESCGLGLLFLRRKSGLPLEFNFTEIDTLHSYFYLRVRVSYPQPKS